jgi:hypothetical protein
VERLGQVVVGSQAEAGDPVAGGASGGQHEHHGAAVAVAVADHPAQRVAVQAGDVAVEDDDLVRAEIELGGRVKPVVGDIHGHALVSEPFGDAVGE